MSFNLDGAVKRNIKNGLDEYLDPYGSDSNLLPPQKYTSTMTGDNVPLLIEDGFLSNALGGKLYYEVEPGSHRNLNNWHAPEAGDVNFADGTVYVDDNRQLEPFEMLLLEKRDKDSPNKEVVAAKNKEIVLPAKIPNQQNMNHLVEVDSEKRRETLEAGVLFVKDSNDNMSTKTLSKGSVIRIEDDKKSSQIKMEIFSAEDLENRDKKLKLQAKQVVGKNDPNVEFIEVKSPELTNQQEISESSSFTLSRRPRRHGDPFVNNRGEEPRNRTYNVTLSPNGSYMPAIGGSRVPVFGEGQDGIRRFKGDLYKDKVYTASAQIEKPTPGSFSYSTSEIYSWPLDPETNLPIVNATIQTLHTTGTLNKTLSLEDKDNLLKQGVIEERTPSEDPKVTKRPGEFKFFEDPKTLYGLTGEKFKSPAVLQINKDGKEIPLTIDDTKNALAQGAVKENSNGQYRLTGKPFIQNDKEVKLKVNNEHEFSLHLKDKELTVGDIYPNGKKTDAEKKSLFTLTKNQILNAKEQGSIDSFGATTEKPFVIENGNGKEIEVYPKSSYGYRPSINGDIVKATTSMGVQLFQHREDQKPSPHSGAANKIQNPGGNNHDKPVPIEWTMLNTFNEQTAKPRYALHHASSDLIVGKTIGFYDKHNPQNTKEANTPLSSSVMRVIKDAVKDAVKNALIGVDYSEDKALQTFVDLRVRGGYPVNTKHGTESQKTIPPKDQGQAAMLQGKAITDKNIAWNNAKMLIGEAMDSYKSALPPAALATAITGLTSGAVLDSTETAITAAVVTAVVATAGIGYKFHRQKDDQLEEKITAARSEDDKLRTNKQTFLGNNDITFVGLFNKTPGKYSAVKDLMDAIATEQYIASGGPREVHKNKTQAKRTSMAVGAAAGLVAGILSHAAGNNEFATTASAVTAAAVMATITAATKFKTFLAANRGEEGLENLEKIFRLPKDSATPRPADDNFSTPVRTHMGGKITGRLSENDVEFVMNERNKRSSNTPPQDGALKGR